VISVETNVILQGDCLSRLKELPDCCVDSIITDPPYGLSFMGKKWDYDVPSVDVWKECLRVLRPGGTALIFAGSRTQHRMAVNVEDAGFILKDCIMWLYGSGFPKATDISKQLDKSVGAERKVIGTKYDLLKIGSKPGTVGDKHEGYQRPWNANANANAYLVSEPETQDAKLWDGWKSHGLKPAYEPILVAMKLNEGSYANNALKHGVSGLNIEDCRIGTEEHIVKGGGSSMKPEWGWHEHKTVQGRYPANIILDEEAGKLLDEQSGESKSISSNRVDKINNINPLNNSSSGAYRVFNISDKGGASRFFYCAKASKSERNKGCEDLEIKQSTGGGGTNNTSDDVCGKYGSIKSAGHNHHPTVKPLKLMEYLCKLTKTPTGGIVLDPFMGSGTTAIACLRTGRKYVLIERESEYISIAKARINHFSKQNRLEDYND
jgi:DNA modification methylase